MKVIREIKDSILNMNRKELGKFDFGLLAIVLFLFFVFDCYADIVTTYLHSMGLLEALTKGKLFQFYDYSTEFISAYRSMVTPPAYPFLVYFIFAIWNLPVFILHQIFGIDYMYPLFLLWCKGMLVLFSAGSVKLLREILKQHGHETKLKLAIFLFSSSLFFVLPVFAVAQYDIIAVFFILWGMKSYLSEERISGRTIILFSVAVTLKYFAILFFIPLVLMREKRIFRCMGNIILSLIPAFLGGIVFPNHSEIVKSGFQSLFLAEKLFGGKIAGGATELCEFVGLYIGTVIWAFYIKPESREAYFKNVVWLGTAVYLLFICFVDINPYWAVLASPFLVLLIVQNPENQKINLILDIFLNVLASLVWIVKYDWIYLWNNNMHYLLFELLQIPACEERKFSKYWNSCIGEEWLPVLFTAAVVCGMGLLVINYPGRKQDSKQAEETSDYGIIRLRLLMPALYIGTDIMLYIWTHVKNLLYPIYAYFFK